MILYPTYNKTLTVSFVKSYAKTALDKLKISTPIYQYEVDQNGIIPNTETLHSGVKALCRTGFSSIFNFNIIIKMNYFDLNALIITGDVYSIFS